VSINKFLLFQQISRVSHFDYVTTDDLMSIGMGKPAARRLLDTVKKRKGTLKKKLIQTFINQSANKDAKNLEKITGTQQQQNSSSLTCLIKESVSDIFLLVIPIDSTLYLYYYLGTENWDTTW
jgi:hypothetical protein